MLTLPFGRGHVAVAQAMKDHIEQAAPDIYEVQIDDLSEHVKLSGHPIRQGIAAIYRWNVTKFGGWPQRVLYNFCDRHPTQVSRFALRVFGRKATTWLKSQQPDIVISTWPLMTYIVAEAFRDSAVPVIGVVTDVGRVNHMWWLGSPHVFCVTHSSLVDQAICAGVPRDRVEDIGLVVRPELIAGLSSSEAKALLGIDATFTVLLAAGGLGYGPNLTRLAKSFGRKQSSAMAQYIVAAGHNISLRESLLRALSPCSAISCDPEDMTLALLAADLVIGKAGWLTLAECIASGKPVIIVDTVPGQEEENAVFIETIGIGRKMSVQSALSAHARYADDPTQIERDFQTARELYRPALGAHLVTIIEKALSNPRREASSPQSLSRDGADPI